MGKGILSTLDGNEAVARVAYKLNEVIAIYPITPASPMGEWCDSWATQAEPNLWGTVPSIVEMQSEGGVAGAIHGALQTGSLTTTFTSSQGLLLMIPNMYKIAGELSPTVFHVASRTVATQALSIFADHSDVMAARATGFAMLASASVQEAHDFALIAQAATLESRVPFLHFFDGFRTSHEVAKIELLTEEDMRALIDMRMIFAHRARSLSPDHPFVRGTIQNSDVFFQTRESVNPYYSTCSVITQNVMDEFAQLVGRQYNIFEYHGSLEADRVIVLMGSGCETVHETVDYLNDHGERVGMIKVRLYHPFDMRRFFESLPPCVRAIAVLDRTKEPGSSGEPLYLECVNAIYEGLSNNWGDLGRLPKIVGGRYGLAAKEFTPAMVKAIFDNLASPKPKNHFTIGIQDDVSHASLPFDATFSIEPPDVTRAIFYGLGADGTVGANRNSIKIIGENTPYYAQGYFVFDSKKAGSMTISHLRFGPHPIHSAYLISKANFLACHQSVFLDRYDMLQSLEEGGIFLLNTPYAPDDIWDRLPRQVQAHLVEKKIQFYVIDAYTVAYELGMGTHINTIMQTCFFALAGVLPREQAIKEIKAAVEETYHLKGDEVVRKNLAAIDQTLLRLHKVEYPQQVASNLEMHPPVPNDAPPFVCDILGRIIAQRGDSLPVSALPVDGTYPPATSRWEKRKLASEIPVWDPALCIQCGKCVLLCPHSVLRSKVYDPAILTDAPAGFKATEAREREWEGLHYTLQISPEDCTGCRICTEICPAHEKGSQNHKALAMQPLDSLLEQERLNWEFFLRIPELDRRQIKLSSLRQQQVMQPLFEFSGACAGCGETPYIKLMSQLFGDRAIIANASGCSSVYGASLPTMPWAVNSEGRGPAWANSLFEDNAEFGMGMRLSLDKQKTFAEELLKQLESELGTQLVADILNADQSTEAGIHDQRERVAILKERLKSIPTENARQLRSLADVLVKRSVWIIGGDGWAYDIDYGGLDHVLASGHDVNILVLDTEVYSNTGGQASKATPRGAVAKFTSGGKSTMKKDLGLIAMTYGNVYVARVAMGAKDEQTLRAFLEAEAYHGVSLIIAYCHCIAHGLPDMAFGPRDQKLAVDTGEWPLYRFHPDRAKRGENPLILDSRPPKLPVEEFMKAENRFRMLSETNPKAAEELLHQAQSDINTRWALYEYLASCSLNNVPHV